MLILRKHTFFSAGVEVDFLKKKIKKKIEVTTTTLSGGERMAARPLIYLLQPKNKNIIVTSSIESSHLSPIFG
jgi:hypothetical protein